MGQKKRLRMVSQNLKSLSKLKKSIAVEHNTASATSGKMKHPQRQSSHQQQHPKFELTPQELVLFVGEGNFSFSAAQAELLGDASQLFCTCYDSQEILETKYPLANDYIDLLKDYQAKIQFGIDATQLQKHYPPKKLPFSALTKERGFDKIIFNFPHTGAGIKDQERNIRVNRELLSKFFVSAMAIISPQGSAFVTLKEGQPYDDWNLKSLALEKGFGVLRSFKFNPSDYPGYEHRRTIGFEEGLSTRNNVDINRGCRTWVFQLKSELIRQASERKKKRKRGSLSDDEDD